MATFLSSAKMNPALRARVESSVHGRRALGAGGSERRLSAWFRFGTGIALVALVGSIFYLRFQARTDREHARARLLSAIQLEASSLSASDRTLPERITPWFPKLARPYTGDIVAEELKTAEALERVLKRPAVYLRAPLEALSKPAATLEAAAASGKDPLLLCFLDPPTSRTEKALFPKVRAAYAGTDSVAAATSNIHRLLPVLVGLPLLGPRWAQLVRNSDDPLELQQLQRQFDRAPLRHAKRASKAEILIVALDEPNEPGGITELDGEHAHSVRLYIVDLKSSRVLLAARKRVDAEWISEARRPEFARGLDGCLLAFEVRAGLLGAGNTGL